MRFGVLGPLAVWTERGEPVTVPGRKVRALLADLLVHDGRPVSADRLVEDLWGEATPADPAAALHVRVSQLRRALAGAEPGARELVVSQAPGYALVAGPAAVDATRFSDLVGKAHAAGEPRARASLLGQALAVWRGAALADFADEEFARPAVARWEELRLAAVEAYAEARLDLGEHRELVGELGEQVARHPFRERLRAAHMRALFRAGRSGEALDSFQDLRHRLAEELGLDPGPELVALHRAILAGDEAEQTPAAPRPVRSATNLPAPVAELVGREHDLQRVRDMLAARRLVTLTGSGGVGKTSVAIAVARTAVDAFPDGVWLVDLTTGDGRSDPADLVLSALSIPDAPGSPELTASRLATAVRERQMLLVLDNCEHVVEPVADLVGGLLPAVPGLRVLATSREPLRLRGEARWELPPLPIPETDDPDRLARSAAVRLFLSRAGLAPTPETVGGVAEVCRRLDGIPLALELAATRVPALGVPELAARLRVPGDRFGLLAAGPRDAPARQRTLTAVIDWSWQLLTGPEHAALRRLAVHSGGCTLAAAEAVCGDDDTGDDHPGGVLELLAGLVDRSLVVRDDGPRFRLLESVGAYCLDRLREAGEETALRRRHADYYLSVAEQAEPHLRGPGQKEWLGRLTAEAANLRAALDTFRAEGAAEPALRLASALTWYWYLRGRLTEARQALAGALAVTGDAPPALRAAAEVWHTGLAIRQGQARPQRAAELMREYEAVAEPGAGPGAKPGAKPGTKPGAKPGAEPGELARAAWFLATAIIDYGDQTATRKLLDQALDTSRAAGDRWVEAATLSTRAMLAHMRDDAAALEHDARRSAELFTELGDDWGVLQATDWLIGLADLTGDQDEAQRLSRSGLRMAENLGLWTDVAGRLAWLAWSAMQVGDYPRALSQAEQARRLSFEQGVRPVQVFATLSLAFAARRGGRLDTAEEHLRWLLASARQQQTGDSSPPYLSMVLTELGLLAEQRGNPAAAMTWHREGFDVARDQGSKRALAWGLAGMASALRDGRPDVAARLLGAADATWPPAIQQLSTSDAQELARITAAVQAAEPDFAALFADGARLTPDQARSLVTEPD